ncbi:GNAT family N-acetyltransferase [Shewanella saliphila]|uniref:N-acetyltransferase n=1 Tax=Shewanella saliphila TaxID=2282698 RepID=A0ABQ2Q736_9GAMM|nr:GNAT family N-acetyltransferase [Shewanella saliphila]MCL1102245.1 GNAT family N-acetyltransferase [Shewanella saliphila]GGP54582.1 N-acetyltransferase [Shewanella saliphila]
MDIDISHHEDEQVMNSLTAGLRQFNVEHLGNESTQPLTIVARSDDGDVIGGVAGQTIYKNFLINIVWIDAKYRGKGLGEELMQLAEIEAIKRGCLIAQLDTLDFQAPIFYEKLGFSVVGKVPKFSGSPARYFMMKQYS